MNYASPSSDPVRRSRTPLSAWVLTATLFNAASGHATGEPPAGPVEWPVPPVGAKTVHRMHQEVRIESKGARVSLTGGLTLDLEEAEAVTASKTGSPVEMRVTIGRMWGIVDEKHPDGMKRVPFREDLDPATGEKFRSTFAAASAGASVIRTVGPPIASGAVAGSSALPRDPLSLTDWMLPPWRTSGPVKVGDAWDDRLSLEFIEPSYGSVPCRHTVESIERDALSIRTDTDAAVGSESAAAPRRLRVLMRRRVSLSDGLTLDGMIDVSGPPPESLGSPGVLFRIQGRWDRIRPTPAPEAVRHAQEAVRTLAGGAATERVSAAASLAGNWPHGAHSLPLLVACLSDDDPTVRTGALEAIQRLATVALERVVPRLAGLPGVDVSGFARAVGAYRLFRDQVTPTDLRGVLDEGALDSWIVAGVASRKWLEPGDLPRAGLLLLTEHATYREADGLPLADVDTLETASLGLALLGLEHLPSGLAPLPSPALLALLRHPQPAVRWVAAILLQRLGRRDSAILGALRAAATAEPPKDDTARRASLELDVGEEIRRTIWALDPTAVVATLRGTDSPERYDRWDLALDVSNRPGAPPEVVTVLLDNLRLMAGSPDWTRIVTALGRLGPQAGSASGALKALLEKPPRDPRYPAGALAAALVRIDGPTNPLLEILGQSLATTDPQEAGRPYHEHTIKSLGLESRSDAASAVGECLPKLDATLRAKAVAALGKSMRAHRDARLREAVCGALLRAGDAVVAEMPNLLATLQETLEDLEKARQRLSPRWSDDYHGASYGGNDFDGPWRVLRVLIETLGRLGTLAKEALPALAPLRDHPDPVLRYLVLRAERRIKGA